MTREFNTKFDLNESIIVKATGKAGEIKSIRINISRSSPDVRKEVVEYMVNTGGFSNLWYKEDDLGYEYDFTDEFESNLIDLMIDVNLPKHEENNHILLDLLQRRQSSEVKE